MSHSSAMIKCQVPHLEKIGVPTGKRLVVGESFKPFPVVAKKVELRKIGKCFCSAAEPVPVVEDDKKGNYLFSMAEWVKAKGKDLIQEAEKTCLWADIGVGWDDQIIEFKFKLSVKWKLIVFLCLAGVLLGWFLRA
ncbi:hypothetical protein CASFOL_025946 [Castilleja foliolosa]|uniref:Uncharacterized protein n=1 Tax=Castilleja foliolosa TaxID=1961234 RepID=A0ABD3CTZ9_9LAMI